MEVSSDTVLIYREIVVYILYHDKKGVIPLSLYHEDVVDRMISVRPVVSVTAERKLSKFVLSLKAQEGIIAVISNRSTIKVLWWQRQLTN